MRKLTISLIRFWIISFLFFEDGTLVSSFISCTAPVIALTNSFRSVSFFFCNSVSGEWARIWNISRLLDSAVLFSVNYTSKKHSRSVRSEWTFLRACWIFLFFFTTDPNACHQQRPDWLVWMELFCDWHQRRSLPFFQLSVKNFVSYCHINLLGDFELIVVRRTPKNYFLNFIIANSWQTSNGFS